MKRSYAKLFKEGPTFRLNMQQTFGNAWELELKEKGEDWKSIGLFMDRKYALLLMKAITLKAREPKKGATKITPLEQSKGRSAGYHEMSARDQWAEDKRLGILDWDGK